MDQDVMPGEAAINRFPAIATDRLTIRPLEPDDAAAIFELYSHPDVVRYYEIGQLVSLADARTLLDAFIKAKRFAITRQGRLIGSCGFIALNAEYRSASLSYDLAREHWGHGFMNEALGALLEFGFDKLGLNRISAVTDPGNLNSIATLSRLGFVPEGLLRELGFWKGQFHDMLLFSLLQRDWASRASRPKN